VTAVEQVYGPDHGREIRVRAYDRTHRLRKRHKVRAHMDMTARALAEELVADLGLSVEAQEDGPKWKMLVQDRQSDLELLAETLERCGLYYTVQDQTLHILSLRGLGDTVDLQLGDTLLEATVLANGDPGCRTVAISGWDPLTAATHGGEASDGRIPWSPPDAVAPEKLGGDGKLFLINEGLSSDGHADAVASAELDQRLGSEVTLDAIAEGNPTLRPGVVVAINGTDDPVEDHFTLTAVDHTIDATRGFVSRLSSQPPEPERRPHTAATTIGIVTRVDDPDSKGRVKVRLPTIGDLETDWMEVVAIAAGSGKGLVALPDVHDTVLVLLPFQDPAAGLVLGGLYGAAGAPAAGGVDHGAVRVFSLLTAGGMKLTFDDANKRLRIEDGHGSFLEMTTQKVTLQAAANLEISAPGKRIRIRGSAIDFETA
jgi:phage baseplate assembly protein gpV